MEYTTINGLMRLPDLMTVADLRSAIHIGRTSVFRMLREGVLTKEIIAGRTLITKESVIRLVMRPGKGGEGECRERD